MLSSIVITKNEEQMLGECLLSLSFSDETIVVDTGNTDSTNDIAKSFGAKIVKCAGDDYSQFRNIGFKAAKYEWILFIDADERVTPLLKQEIEHIISSPDSNNVFQIPRRNIYLNREMHHGGWGSDKVIRLFRKSALKGYEGQLHEQPVYDGKLSTLNSELVHFSHRDLSSMLDKTLEFTAYEAQLRNLSHHPPVVWWRFVRVMLTEFWLRFIKFGAWRDGVEGVIDGMFQVFNSFIIYARLWEMQQNAQSRRL